MVSLNDGAFDKLKEHVGQRIPNDVKFEIALVTVDFVQTSLQSFDITKALVWDGLSLCLLQVAAPAIYHPLIIINRSIQSGTFPDIWKLNKLIPIHKSGSLLDMGNFR